MSTAIRIPVHYKGEVVAHALVDPCDAGQAQHRWSLNGGYVCRWHRVAGKVQVIGLHREILGLLRGGGHRTLGDHRNGDKLDHRRSNLRPSTSSQNARNRAGRGASLTPGVSYHKPSAKWRVKIDFGGFDTEEEAAELARTLYQQFFPEHEVHLRAVA